MTDILNVVDKKNACLLSLLDLSAAFDTIDHSILIDRLCHTFGIRGTLSLGLSPTFIIDLSLSK